MGKREKVEESVRKREKAWEKKSKCGNAKERERLRENENTPERNCVCKKKRQEIVNDAAQLD